MAQAIKVTARNGKTYTVRFAGDGQVSCITGPRRTLSLNNPVLWDRHSARGWGPVLKEVVSLAVDARA